MDERTREIINLVGGCAQKCQPDECNCAAAIDSMLKAARAEAFKEIAVRIENNARAIRNLAQGFVADGMMGQLAAVRAEALEEQAQAIRASADKEEGNG